MLPRRATKVSDQAVLASLRAAWVPLARPRPATCVDEGHAQYCTCPGLDFAHRCGHEATTAAWQAASPNGRWDDEIRPLNARAIGAGAGRVAPPSTATRPASFDSVVPPVPFAPPVPLFGGDPSADPSAMGARACTLRIVGSLEHDTTLATTRQMAEGRLLPHARSPTRRTRTLHD
jgi:hypothetical protein